MAPRKDLGSILVEENVISQKDLERVDRERGTRPLWTALIEAELTTEDEIFFLLAQRFGTPVLAEDVILDAKMPDAVRRALSREQAMAAGLLPIELQPDGRRVTVVMVDPSDEAQLAAFLTRAQVPEGRALLGRRSAIERAIERAWPTPRASLLQPAPPQKPGGAKSPTPNAPNKTAQIAKPAQSAGSVELDPMLAAEIQRLPQRVLASEPLTPLPRVRRKKPTPAPQVAPAGVAPSEPEGAQESLRAEERLSHALVQTVEALAAELELRVQGMPGAEGSRVGRPGVAAEMARLARRVARQLGLARRAAEEIGVAAQLYAVDRLLRAVDGGEPIEPRFGELGWPASGEGGLLAILRALTAASSGFARGTAAAPPVGARIIALVSDYLELGAAAGEADLGTVSQLLRASSAGTQVVDALLHVLEDERADPTPATRLTTLPATSVLHEPEPELEPEAEVEKTVKKLAPSAPRRREPPQE